jgi:hypothetical protein
MSINIDLKIGSTLKDAIFYYFTRTENVNDCCQACEGALARYKCVSDDTPCIIFHVKSSENFDISTAMTIEVPCSTNRDIELFHLCAFVSKDNEQKR